MTQVWADLLEEARALHDATPDLQAFCTFPEIALTDEFRPQVDPLCATLTRDSSLGGPYAAFTDACLAAAPHALWRGTYRDTPIGDVLHKHFGTFEILGRDTPLQTDAMRGFLIYQTAGYHYPLHHHPAEEMYLVLAGGAEFLVEGESSQHLDAGKTCFHASNRPHALTTHDRSVLAYVLWRGDIETRPVFTYPDQLS